MKNNYDASLRVADFVARHIEIQAATGRTARQIAAEVGYRNPNMISMIKTGRANVPFEKIPALARALRVDVALLLRLALEQQSPKINKAISGVFGTIPTANERDTIETVRMVSKSSVIAITEKQKAKLGAIFETTP
jgi:transcriptional regulator with XRE-family HTH domain